jgi:hypothetical protein
VSPPLTHPLSPRYGFVPQVNTYYKNLLAGTCSTEAKAKAAKYALPKQ